MFEKNNKNAFLIMAIAMVVASVAFFSYISPATIDDSWASKEIRKWGDKGVFGGSSYENLKPDNLMLKAEFLIVLDNILNLPETEDMTFNDIADDAWYRGHISRCVAAGIISPDEEGNINPTSPIKREEAAVILANVFKLKAKDSNAVNVYKDADEIDDWALDAMNAMVERGYMIGRTEGKIGAQRLLLWADGVKLIDNVAGDLYYKPGTYSEDVDSNLVINTKGIILKDMTINGNLYLTQGIGNEKIRLENVNVKGDIVILGNAQVEMVQSNQSNQTESETN